MGPAHVTRVGKQRKIPPRRHRRNVEQVLDVRHSDAPASAQLLENLAPPLGGHQLASSGCQFTHRYA